MNYYKGKDGWLYFIYRVLPKEEYTDNVWLWVKGYEELVKRGCHKGIFVSEEKLKNDFMLITEEDFLNMFNTPFCCRISEEELEKEYKLI
jgi:hypothetical protein